MKAQSQNPTPSAPGAEPPVAVVTGVTGGIGRWIALGLARAGLYVVLIGRDQARTEAARCWIAEQAPHARTELVIADLSMLVATRGVGEGIAMRHPRIAILVTTLGCSTPSALSRARDVSAC
jgi:retinol dehydrogenase 12